jgi:hypothetical protein
MRRHAQQHRIIHPSEPTVLGLDLDPIEILLSCLVRFVGDCRIEETRGYSMEGYNYCRK